MPIIIWHTHSLKIVTALAAALLFFGISLYMGMGREPIASAETRFAEHSAHGLNIVTASCESTPYSGTYEHYQGECAPVDVCPSVPGFQSSGPCDVCQNIAGLQTSGPCDFCPNDPGIQNTGPCDACPADPGFQMTGPCEGGVGGGRDACPNDPGVQGSGPCAGEGVCPLGYVGTPPNCVFSRCPIDHTLNESTGFCEKSVAECVPQLICGSGATTDMIINSCTGAVISNCSSHGSNWFCSGGQCLFTSSSGGSREGDIKVSPARVRSGERTRVTWGAEGFSTCTVSENNPEIEDVWTVLSATQWSSPITQRTKYTLVCDGVEVDNATVNIIPIFIER